MTDTQTRKEFLPFCRPSIGPEEEQAVLEVLRSGWLTTGPKAMQFEKEFAEFKGCKHAVSTNSCTSALHLALVALGIGRGDEVITSPITWPSTANVVVHTGARPVFVDVEPDTLLIDANKIEDAITERTKAILPVHLAGQVCDMDRINDIAEHWHLKVIEDSAHAIEAEYKGRKTGTLGDCGGFSLYPTKNITACEGGMLTTNDGGIADLAKIYSFNGIDRDAWKRYGTEGYKHWETIYPGFKYNMPDIAAAIGICQLKKIGDFWLRRKAITGTYDREFAGLFEMKPLARRFYGVHSYHLYVVLLDLTQLTVNRDTIMNAIQAENIGIGVHFRSLHLQTAYRSWYSWSDLPVAADISGRVLSLPLYPAMTDQDVQDVTVAVRKVLARYRR